MVLEDFKNIEGVWARTIRIHGKQIYTKAGRTFDAMSSRCRDGGSKQRYQPQYMGCTMSDSFKDFQFFVDWCHKQVGYFSDGYALDKDILLRGNKIYSEDVCVFVPQRVNNLLLKSRKIRGSLPIGVSYEEKAKAFRADCRLGVGRRSKFLGYFDNSDSAFCAYKMFKESLIKEVANFYREDVDKRVFDSLMSYEVLITD